MTAPYYESGSMMYWSNLAATFLVLAVLLARLALTPYPQRTASSATGWLLWLAAHIAVGIPMIYQLQLQWERDQVPGLSVVCFKLGLALILASPWRAKGVH